MQTVENPPADPGASSPSTSDRSQPPGGAGNDELHLLLSWAPDSDEKQRLRAAAIGTLVVHLLIVSGLGVMPRQTVNPRSFHPRQIEITKLIDPITELTQKAPNKAKVSKEIVVQSPAAANPIPNPAPGARARKFEPPPSKQPVKQPVAGPSVVEPPRIEQAQANSPSIALPQLPQIQPQERTPSESKPKLAFENPAPPPSAPSGNSRVPVPGNTVQEAVRELSRGGNRGLSGSDSVDLGNGSGLNMPPSPGRPRMDFEMKSDPMGVDFRPYILQVLATVRRNWFAVYPESAKLGTRGQVKLDFAIAKDGKVTKVAFSSQSGAQALDHAAVAAISASNPLPPLPVDYRGERIILSFTFSYNLAR